MGKDYARFICVTHIRLEDFKNGKFLDYNTW